MWFRNLQIYRLRDWKISPQTLEEKLSAHTLATCASSEMMTRGWIAPRGDSLVYSLGSNMLICLGVEKKLLPAAVVKQHAALRAEEIEEREGRRPGRKEMREIMEQSSAELLPRAFSLRRSTSAWIDPVGGWLVVDCANSSKAEELLDLLRKSLDEFPLFLLKTRLSPVSAMTEWLATGEAPACFSIDRDCELRAAGEEKATVRYVRHNLEAQEISGHIAAGKQASRLAMTWRDKLSFVLDEKLQVKKLSALDILKEQNEGASDEERFDADFALMAGELSHFLPELLQALGGEEE